MSFVGITRENLVSNILMIVLVVINIFFGIQYTQSIRLEDKQLEAEIARTEERIETSRFMKLFIDKVLGTNGVISFEDRVKLESDVRDLGDTALVDMWESFVASADGEEAQKRAVQFMSLLSSKMI